MDGVAYITQCPIGPGQTFTYKFKVCYTKISYKHFHSDKQYYRDCHKMSSFLLTLIQYNPVLTYFKGLADLVHYTRSTL